MIKLPRLTLIEGFEAYAVQDNGNTYYLDDKFPYKAVPKRLSKRLDRGGYFACRLCKNGQAYTKRVLRLLAQHFIPNPLNLPVVDHADGNRLNNALPNLRWCTPAQNVQAAYDLGLNSAAKKIIDTTTGEVYPSISKAASAIGLNYNTCCKQLEKCDPEFRLQYFR